MLAPEVVDDGVLVLLLVDALWPPPHAATRTAVATPNPIIRGRIEAKISDLGRPGKRLDRNPATQIPGHLRGGRIPAALPTPRRARASGFAASASLGC